LHVSPVLEVAVPVKTNSNKIALLVMPVSCNFPILRGVPFSNPQRAIQE
jgi:hypothetical protein